MPATIGIDPHKSTHTAVAVDATNTRSRDSPCPRIGIRPTGCWPGRNHSTLTACGRSSPPPVSDDFSLNSCSLPANALSMCHRC